MLLTDFSITKTKPDPARELRLNDGEGLHVAVLPNGKRYWRWDYSIHGRRKQLAFGRYPVVGLKKAREKKLAAQALVADGIDPSHARKTEKIAAIQDTFRAVSEEWLTREAATITAETVAKKRAQLERYLLPALGPLTIGKISTLQVLPLLKAIERQSKHDTAHRVCQMASEIFRYAVITERADADPAGLLGGALRPVITEHHASLLDPIEVGKLLTAIDNVSGSPFVVGAMKLLPLVFLRSRELRHAEWREIDLDAAMWRIPARRMKQIPGDPRPDHLVPLATQAVAILRDLQTINGDGTLVFPGLKNRRQAVADATPRAVLERLGYTPDQQTIHGFRTLASTHLREIGFEGDLVELQLSHKIANPVRAAYDRAARIPERVRMMQAWADHLDAMKAGRVQAFTGRILEHTPRGAAAAG